MIIHNLGPPAGIAWLARFDGSFPSACFLLVIVAAASGIGVKASICGCCCAVGRVRETSRCFPQSALDGRGECHSMGKRSQRCRHEVF